MFIILGYVFVDLVDESIYFDVIMIIVGLGNGVMIVGRLDFCFLVMLMKGFLYRFNCV